MFNGEEFNLDKAMQFKSLVFGTLFINFAELLSQKIQIKIICIFIIRINPSFVDYPISVHHEVYIYYESCLGHFRVCPY